MPTERKEQSVKALVQKFSKARIAVLTDYRGLTVSELGQLRRRLTDAGADYQVVKNTLARIAAEQVGKKAIAPMLAGPTAVAFGYDDETKPAKVLVDYIRTTPRTPLTIKGGILEREPLSADQVNALATLPPRSEMLGKVMGGLNTPGASLAGALSGGARMLVYALEARRKQLEEQAGAAA